MDLAERPKRPELLAPAGNIESFFAALEHGADAVYVGYRHYNARALAANFSLEEIARLNEYAHGQKARLYVALNSLLREDELEKLVDILAGLAQIEPDGLIIQDPAIALLCRRHFPSLDLHASTLMMVHNSSGVEHLETLGFKRAVLARELTLDEVAQIAGRTRLELEVFVHGALCFSYSGLCLASSFYGGRSSLRGRCTQPCRRFYRSGRNQGYFFSTNDLSAIHLIPRLVKLRLTAFKIEGRMKPASYVGAVIRAYRLVMDAPAGHEAEANAEALRLLKEAPGRKPSQGFFVAAQHKEIVTPHRSGASGRLAAHIEWVRGNRMGLRVRLPLSEGDRLRLESDDAAEKTALTVKDMTANGKRISKAAVGTMVAIPRSGEARQGDRLFKTGSKTGGQTSTAKLRRTLREKTSAPRRLSVFPGLVRKILTKPSRREEKSEPTVFYLRLDHYNLLSASFDSGARWVLLQATRSNLHHLSRQKLPPARKDRLFCALPPIIPEVGLPFYREQVRQLQGMGYGRWLVANWGHFRLFTKPPEVLVADYTFNVLNSQAGSLLHELGCEFIILSLENDRHSLQKLLPAISGFTPLLTVYGKPPLFTSRLAIRPRQGGAIWGLGRDSLRHSRQDGLTPVRSDRPFCLLERIQELRKLGVSGFVVDVRGERLRPRDLLTLMQSAQRQQCPQPHSTFNFQRRLV